MKRRAAFTLIEVSVAATIGVALMILSVVLLSQTFRLHSQATRQMASSRSLDQLSRQFRRDIRLAETIELQSDGADDDSPNQLIVSFSDDMSAHYGYSKTRQPVIERRLLRDGETIARDAFGLPMHAQIRFEQLSSPDRVVLEVHSIDKATVKNPNPDSNSNQSLRPSPKLERRISAVIGRLLELQAVEDRS